jgi:hypothetical protein
MFDVSTFQVNPIQRMLRIKCASSLLAVIPITFQAGTTGYKRIRRLRIVSDVRTQANSQCT